MVNGRKGVGPSIPRRSPLAILRIGRVVLPLLAWGCASDRPTVDSGASEVAELTGADRAFAQASAARGAEAWAEAWSEGGRKEAPNGPGVVGPAAVRAAMAPVLERYGPRFRWEPEHGAMLWPDTLGYTTGRWWIDEVGAGSSAGGRYLTVWIREAGQWKVALDVSASVCGSAPASHAFDFWQGEWRIVERIRAEDGGQEIYRARDAVAPVAGACALAESWAGMVRYPWARMEHPRRIRGASIRVYDPSSERWSIYWIDTVTRRFGLPFRGSFDGDVGDFLLQPPDSDSAPRRIRFRRGGEGGAVDWDLAVQQPDSDWIPLWSMHFERH